MREIQSLIPALSGAFQTKQALREQAFQLLRGRAQESVQNQNIQFNTYLESLLQSRSGLWAAYRPLANEPRPELSKFKHLKWCYPQVRGDSMSFLIPGPKGFAKNSFGSEDPVTEGAEEIAIERISGFLVPGLAFDLTGTRLGRGLGYYDRALATATKAEKIGVCFGEQIFSQVPHESHDLRLQTLVTDRGILKLNNQSRQELDSWKLS